ncbi:MAG: S8 family serine peptidase [Candidatus Hodarchaeota archaeon]
MKTVKKKILLFVFIGFLMTVATSGNGGNPFADEISTENGYPTWDSDVVNIEGVDETGSNVYIAVLDTGLAPYWDDYFPEERIAIEYGIGFQEALVWDKEINDFVETTGEVHTTTFIGSRGSCHGTHVTSTIIGYFYDTMVDETNGYDIPPIMVRGIAPNVKIIPVKVLVDYQIPQHYDDAGNLIPPQTVVFGTDRMVAAGIQYIADLAPSLDGPVIISMSLGGPTPDIETEEAINNAIENGVIVVASAGNEGELGMGWPGAYPQVISVGAVGWRYEWWWPGLPDDEGDGPDPDESGYVNSYSPLEDQRNRLWWLQSQYNDFKDVVEENLADDVYITDFSSRERPDHPYGIQELDVLAPGSWVRGPYPGTPGYAHLAWWGNGLGGVRGWNPGNFYYVGGTSMAAPHVSGIAALMLQANPTLNQADIEQIMKSTALEIQPGSMDIVDALYDEIGNFLGWGWRTVEWESDAIGSGLIQADLAVAAA